MTTSEPIATAVLLAVVGALLLVSTFFSRASSRVSIPVVLFFLVLGMLAGSEGVLGIAFEDYHLAFRLGTIALVLILFDGGLNTPVDVVRDAIRPAGLLATVGVAGTAAIVAVAAHLLGFGWGESLLLGAVVSSTDAAAVFSVLRGSGLSLKRRIAATLEVESGLNDPMAVILTVVFTENLVSPIPNIGWMLVKDIVIQMVVGALIGVGVGRAARWSIARMRLPSGGLYPVATLAIAFLAYAIPTLVHGSGFLSVYICAVVLGSAHVPYRSGLFRVHDALAWLSQIAIFFVLGLLVFPSRLVTVAADGLILALVLALLARPISVALCLLPLRTRPRDVVYTSWVGLRGAVPIILATIPVLYLGAQSEQAQHIFNLVFFIVVANALVPGTTVPWVTRKLGLESNEPPRPPAVLEVESLQPLTGELRSYYIDEDLAVAGATLSELPFPEGAAVALIVRRTEIIAPRGNTRIEVDDHVYVLSREEDRPLIELMFGGAEGG